MRPLASALALAVALLASGCGDSDCQKLGERLCSCTGLSGDSCKAQVQGEIDSANPSESSCTGFLDSCNPPPDAQLCEWILTCSGKVACGLAAQGSCTTP
jgi:hypothetical protein